MLCKMRLLSLCFHTKHEDVKALNKSSQVPINNGFAYSTPCPPLFCHAFYDFIRSSILKLEVYDTFSLTLEDNDDLVYSQHDSG